jgi:hypothetical protein
MRAKGFLLLGALSPLVQGCAVYSFAPPRVNIAYVTEDTGEWNPKCKFALKPKGPDADHKDDPFKHVKQTFGGGNHLIDNYLMVYRCTARNVANGRQQFEIPALLLAAGGVTAAAFGAPASAAIATGAVGAALANGKGYYAPREKAPILAASVDALTCVKSEANGLKAYATSLIDKASEKGKDKTADPKDDDNDAANLAAATSRQGGATIAVTAAKQYFVLVQTAVFSIENIAAQRLGSVGTYAPDALMSEITALSEKIKAQEKAKPDAATEEAAEQNAEKIVKTDPDADAALKAVTPEVSPIDIQGVETPILITPAAKQLAANDPDKLKTFVAPLRPGLIDQSMILAKSGTDFEMQALPEESKILIAQKAEAVGAKAAVTSTLLHIDKMQPKLDLCVVRAKL